MTKRVIPIQSARDHAPIEQLMARDPQAAEKLFNSLSLAEKVQQVLAAPWDKRMAMIQLAHNARELVQSLPTDELYWTIKQRGPEDALGLITLTTHEQFQYIVDIDCWRKESLDPASLALWYRLLSKCHETKVLDWFTLADDALLVSSLKQFISIFKMQEDTDISEEYEKMPPTTVDGVYYFTFLNAEAHQYIMPLLNALYQERPNRFYSIVEGILWDSGIEAEDEAYHWRKSRIAEQGFPDSDEAMSIYQFMSDKECALLHKGCLKCSDGSDEASVGTYGIRLRYSMQQEGMPLFLADVLRMLTEAAVLDTVQRSLVHVANKLMTADGLAANSFDDLQLAMRKVLGYVSIGLEMLSDGNPSRGAGMLAQVHPEILFRIGFSAVVKLQQRFAGLRQQLWSAAPEYGIVFFDSPWSDALQGLQRKRPLLFEGLATPGALDYRDFASLHDLRLLAQVVDIMEVSSLLLFDFIRIDPARLFSGGDETAALCDASDIRCSAVFLTAVANHVLFGRAALDPLDADGFRRFLQTVFEYRSGQDRYGLRASFDGELRSWLASGYPLEERLQTALDAFVTACLAMLDEEFSSLVGKKTIDTRYVSGLILKKDA